MAESKNFTKGLSACLKIVSKYWVFRSLLTILSLMDVQSHFFLCLAILVVLVFLLSNPGLINRAYSPQRVKELEEEAKAKALGAGARSTRRWWLRNFWNALVWSSGFSASGLTTWRQMGSL